MRNFESVLEKIGLLDLIFLIPMFLLFSYLPVDNFWSILINIVIVIFFAFGLAIAFHIIYDYFRKKHSD